MQQCCFVTSFILLMNQVSLKVSWHSSSIHPILPDRAFEQLMLCNFLLTLILAPGYRGRQITPVITEQYLPFNPISFTLLSLSQSHTHPFSQPLFRPQLSPISVSLPNMCMTHSSFFINYVSKGCKCEINNFLICFSIVKKKKNTLDIFLRAHLNQVVDYLFF